MQMRSNPQTPSKEQLKHARRVREGREPGLIFVEGLRLAEECLRSGCPVERCFITPGVTAPTSLQHQDVPVFHTSAEVMEQLGDTVQSQGIILVAQRPQPDSAALFADGTTLLLGLDRVQDPGNMGTLIRTAEAAGAGGIVALGGSVDVFSPKVLRSSMGSAFRMPVLADATAEHLLTLRQQRRLRIVAATGAGELDYCDYDWRQPTLLLLGNEAHGVAADLLPLCDARLRIPLQAGVESLNVAAAGAVMLFEGARQRRQIPELIEDG